MTNRPQTIPTVFVSYSHDSENHKKRVAQLATRLREEGIDCDLDEWVGSPSEGWPMWMMKQVATSKFTIVVCTEKYYCRVTGTGEIGGLGSKWEGALITQELYESGGTNSKFIPIIFEPVDEKWRPPFLRGATFYDLSTTAGYERLYRHLTEQPALVKPPLGKIRQLSTDEALSTTKASVPSHLSITARNLSSLVLVFPLEGGFAPITALSHRLELGERLVMEVTPEDTTTAGILNSLRQRKDLQVGVAFGTTPVFGRLQDAKQIVTDGEERWLLTVAPSAEHIQGALGEMSFGNTSADDIAEMRARRILLNEQVLEAAAGQVDKLNAVMLEVLIRGMNMPITVKGSPFPRLFRELAGDPQYFVAVCRLFGILFLYLSATVDRIFRFELQLREPTMLEVEFEGQRPRKYVNVEPPILRVRGDCDLSKQESEA
jgi:hypothetical protein